jgi:dUTP pyrophosphatase
VLGGLIDPGYRGEVRVILYNADPVRHFPVNVGDRIAQLVITAAFTDAVQEVDEFTVLTDRGEKGFGSTGKV